MLRLKKSLERSRQKFIEPSLPPSKSLIASGQDKKNSTKPQKKLSLKDVKVLGGP